ncbi:NADPH-dependent assimilatory sulfite reductase hemoprotein subunit [Acidithrix ferrooxidans]|uniref:assimilatory sulfite reductase (ferredoxin) n=1 Tax=Acidithrix ferrooxidans TaxID=1280514 RepID=A0A0D8HJD2_9ACTN|nr:NADPH-dependent assimilatory sulfite reductase hemoprotein subunit [Acidithrix ferrooxidans]KJF17196.1 sulfite reductase [Acidithrix ferrooxidans]
METDIQKTIKNISAVEKVKENSNSLRGTIASELENDDPKFSNEASQILKFHGIYTQDNRDSRSTRLKAGLEIEHLVMARVSIPGGRISSEQYLALNQIANDLGNSTLRLTTRQGIQFHFVTKQDVRELLSRINETLLTTWGGCGDVIRNVTACPNVEDPRVKTVVERVANEISNRYKAPSDAYFEFWIDGEKVAESISGAKTQERSIYRANMLPRKFKIGVVSSIDNCIDVLSHDLGIVVDNENSQIIRLYVGGGLGRSGTDESTFARLGDLLGEIDIESLFAFTDAIIELQRDLGDRNDRAHARLKYLIARIGVDEFRRLVEEKVDIRFQPAEKDLFLATNDHLGLTRNKFNNSYALGIKLPSGRIADTAPINHRTAISTIVQRYRPNLAVTAKGDLILTDLASEIAPNLQDDLEALGVPSLKRQKPIFVSSFACVALPTCGLALAESERYLPTFLGQLQDRLELLGIGDDDIEVRMTGCPNGCARPYLAEIGIVGRTKKSYDIFLGSDREGTRLNQLFAEDVEKESIVDSLAPLLIAWRDERKESERFGDFIYRLERSRLTAYVPAPRRQRIKVSASSKESL